jgi:hypothetical protein
MRGISVLIIGAIVLLGLPGHAQAEPPQETLGRRNPYRPLIGPRREPAGLPALPSDRGGEPAREAPKLLETVLDRLAYVGIAYDETEAIAAVSDGDRTWFVRVGDRLEGAAVTSITPHKLTWSRKGRLIVKHLRREGVL